MTANTAAPGGASSDPARSDTKPLEEPLPPPERAGGGAMRKQGNDLLTMGLSVGAVGVVGAAIGAVCPLCVIATPALLGAGAIRRWQAHRRDLRAQAASSEVEPAG